MGFVTGGALGLGLLITWIGLPILLTTLAGATLVARLEAWLAVHLVGVEASGPGDLREFKVGDETTLPGDGFLAAVERLLMARSTYASVLLVLTKFGFGLVSFIALVTTGALSLAMLAAPLVYDTTAISLGRIGPATAGQYNIGPWIVDTLPEATVVAVGGVALVILSMNLLNTLAWVHARYTAAILRIDDENA